MSEAIFGFIGVFIGAIIPWIKETLNERAQRGRHARYLAIQVIRVLEEFIDKCSDVVFDDGTSEGRPAGRYSSGEMYNEAQVTCPEAPVYPPDLDWRSIDTDTVYRIVMLSNMKRSVDLRISDAADHDSPPDYGEFFRARWEGYAELGLEAFAICEKLRKSYNLPQPDWRYYNPKKVFEEKKGEVERQRKRIEDSNRVFLSEQSSSVQSIPMRTAGTE
jgi:hypothetical protein